MSEEYSLSFDLDDETIKKIKETLLKDTGIIHYVLEIDKDNRLDVVEYSEYEKLEQELSKYKDMRKKAIEKLLCWGETLEPEFQSSMLELLEFNEKEWQE